MQQVSLYDQGERDYTEIKGDTGPLVYPAGHLYVYSFLSKICGVHTLSPDEAIRCAQYIFGALYLLNLVLIMEIYSEARKSHIKNADVKSVWSYRIAMALCCLSKRLHSIFVLRLFNDAIAMLFLYASVYLFMRSRWNIGCCLFSVAVSIKMNILLFAPGLLLLLLQAGSGLWFTFVNLALCGGLQLVLGAPFLFAHPVSYLRKAFEFDRVFMYKWTVNWKVCTSKCCVEKNWIWADSARIFFS